MHSKPQQRRLVHWLRDAIVVMLLLSLLHIWQTWGTAAGVAPSLVGKTLAGEEIRLSQQTDAPILIHFWATWCPVCRFEADNINTLNKEYPVITVAMKSGDSRKINDYLLENSLGFPVISDPDGQLADIWGVSAVPTTFIVDGSGKIRFVEVGYSTALGLRLRIWWAGLRWNK